MVKDVAWDVWWGEVAIGVNGVKPVLRSTMDNFFSRAARRSPSETHIAIVAKPAQGYWMRTEVHGTRWSKISAGASFGA